MRRRDWMELPKNRFLRGVYLLVQRYLRHNVGMQGAALAFYLLFMIFPLLIFISSLLGLLQLDVDAILAVLGEFLPREVVSFVGMYLTYVGRNPSVKLLLFGLFFSLYFPMRATNTLMRSVRIAYHLGPPRGALSQLVKTLLYTAVLIATIALTLTLMSVGDRLLLYGRRCGRTCGSRWRRWRGILPCSSCTPCPRTDASPGGTSGPAPWRPWGPGCC